VLDPHGQLPVIGLRAAHLRPMADLRGTAPLVAQRGLGMAEGELIGMSRAWRGTIQGLAARCTL
jgi:hypothetical protein